MKVKNYSILVVSKSYYIPESVKYKEVTQD